MRLPILLLFLYSLSVLSLQARDYPVEDSTKKKTFIVLPIISYSPETRLRGGVIGINFFRFKNAVPGTRLSTLKFPISYTLENQFKAKMSYEVAFSGNENLLEGQFAFSRFPLLFYGIGSDTQEENEEIFTTRTLKIELNYLNQVTPSIFLGFRFDRNDSKITEVEEDRGLLRLEDVIVGNEGGVSSGIGAIFRWDRRGNIFNPVRGPFVEAVLTTYQPWLGSDFDYTKLAMDVRHYLKIVHGRHILALNAVAERNWGEPSFETTALLGNDQIMRGHYEGRFRDHTLLAAQVEYRFPLGRKNWINQRTDLPLAQRFGLVAFAGLGDVAPELSDFSIDNIKHSLGLGLRFLANQEENVNVRLDFAFGTQNPGFYLNIRESF